MTHLFDVEIEGVVQGRFQEVSGLSGTNEVTEIKEGGLNGRVHKFVNRSSAGDLVLKRGFVNSWELFDWFKRAAVNSLTERHNGHIIMKDDNNEEIWRWSFFRAFPAKWEGPTFNAAQSGVAVESITLVCEWVEGW